MDGQYVGQMRLHEKLGLDVPAPFVRSIVARGVRRTTENPDHREERYPIRYLPFDADGPETDVDHLKFALKHEPLDMGVLAAAFRKMSEAELANWVDDEPSGAHARRAWFLFERLTGRTLFPADKEAGPYAYVDALDPDLHVVAAGERSKRHKVVDNTIGVPGFNLTIRRTGIIRAREAQRLDEMAKSYTADIPHAVLNRAVQYLYTKETKSSFEIEHETASPEKARRFMAALTAGAQFDPTDVGCLVDLQNHIVDPRYAAPGLRDFQNFVGQTLDGYREKIHFVCPKPEDVGPLMDDWIGLTRRLRRDADPVTAAAAIAFTFVFIHPFEDGNGRIHRFLIHHVRSSRGFTPEGMIFPVSAAILRNLKDYDAALESFSVPLLRHVRHRMNASREVEVLNDTDYLYRYFDATKLVEYLYDKLDETIETDLRQEVEFVDRFDRAYRAVTDIVDMPDRRASLFVKVCMQNGGNLSKAKRPQFAELTDAEIERLEGAVKEAIAPAAPETASPAM